MKVTHRLLLKGSFSLVASKALVLTGSLVGVAALTRLFDSQEYGVWAILYSVFNLIYMTDFGLGISLRNRMSECAARGDETGARDAFFSLFYLLSILALVLAAVVIVGMRYYLPFGSHLYSQATLVVVLMA